MLYSFMISENRIWEEDRRKQTNMEELFISEYNSDLTNSEFKYI